MFFRCPEGPLAASATSRRLPAGRVATRTALRRLSRMGWVAGCVLAGLLTYESAPATPPCGILPEAQPVARLLSGQCNESRVAFPVAAGRAVVHGGLRVGSWSGPSRPRCADASRASGLRERGHRDRLTGFPARPRRNELDLTPRPPRDAVRTMPLALAAPPPARCIAPPSEGPLVGAVRAVGRLA